MPSGLCLVLAAVIAPSMQGVSFQDITGRAGLKGGGRASWGDVNGDGWPDVVIGRQLFLNRGNGTFENATKRAGLTGAPGGSALIADFDNDGNADLYFTGGEGALFLGDGKGAFRKGHADPNPYKKAQAAAAADIDGDGWLDVYIANYEDWQKTNTFPYPDVILKNRRGTLRRSWEAGKGKIFPGRGVSFCDFDEDGDLDAYVSNYRLAPNLLWVNGGRGNLRDEAEARGCAGGVRKNVPLRDNRGQLYHSSGHTIGSCWADFDNDGWFDLFVGNFSHPPKWQDRPQMLRNTGKKGGFRFEDKSGTAKIPWQESYASPAAADFDNDGRIDLYFTTVYDRDRSKLFRNEGGWRFRDVTPGPLRTEKTYQAAWADFDNDGRMDLLTQGRLFRNETKGGEWIKVRLEGRDCNRFAVGAIVKIEAGGSVVTRQVECGTGSGNQNDLTLHFGLGNHKGPVEIQVRWPCGRAQAVKGRVRKTVKIRESGRRR